MAAEAVGVDEVLALALAAAAAAAAAPRLRLVVTAPRWAFVERPLLLSPARPRFVPRRGMVLLTHVEQNTRVTPHCSVRTGLWETTGPRAALPRTERLRECTSIRQE